MKHLAVLMMMVMLATCSPAKPRKSSTWSRETFGDTPKVWELEPAHSWHDLRKVIGEKVCNIFRTFSCTPRIYYRWSKEMPELVPYTLPPRK